MRIIRYTLERVKEDIPGEALTKTNMPVGEGLLVVGDDCEKSGDFLPDAVVRKVIRTKDPRFDDLIGPRIQEIQITCARTYAEIDDLPAVTANCTVIRLTKADLGHLVPEAPANAS